MIQAPGDASRWFVVEQQGIVRVIPNMANATDADVSVFIDISARVLDGGERGLLGMAFHPNFGNGNFEVFFSYTRNNGGTESAITRFRSIDNGLTLDDTVEDIILTIPQDFDNHNGGKIEFGPDGYLYAGWGDGGSGNDPNDRGQDTMNLLGTFTRASTSMAAFRIRFLPTIHSLLMRLTRARRDSAGAIVRKSTRMACAIPGAGVSIDPLAISGPATSARAPGKRSTG